jgi:hypothetical protein
VVKRVHIAKFINVVEVVPCVVMRNIILKILKYQKIYKKFLLCSRIPNHMYTYIVKQNLLTISSRCNSLLKTSRKYRTTYAYAPRCLFFTTDVAVKRHNLSND